MHEMTGNVWDPLRFVIRVQKSLFACKNHRWGLGAIETSNSDAKHADLHAEYHRWGLGPIETCNLGPKVAVLSEQHRRWGLEPIETSISVANHSVLHAQNDRWGLGPIATCNSGPIVALLHAKIKDERWHPQRLVFLMLITLVSMHKMPDEVWDQ